MAETWLSSCVKVPFPNPLTRLGYPASWGVPHGDQPYSNEMLAIVNHSAEGNFSTTNLPIAVMTARGNSWHITIFNDGRKQQHFPLEGICWHAGTKANYRYIGIEHEGLAGEALTPAQKAATIQVQSEIARFRGWVAVIRNQTGFEHNQFMATSCPSGRIPWAEIEAGTRVPAPAPAPAPTGIWPDVQQVSLNVTLYTDTNLVKLPEGIVVKPLVKGTVLQVKGLWKGTHYLTAWSFDNKIPNGFAVSATVAPAPPAPIPVDPCASVKAELAEAQQQVQLLQTKIVERDTLIQHLQTKIANAKTALQNLLTSL